MKIGEVAPPQLRDGLRRMENTFCSSYPALAPQRGTRLGGVPGYYRSSLAGLERCGVKRGRSTAKGPLFRQQNQDSRHPALRRVSLYSCRGDARRKSGRGFRAAGLHEGIAPVQTQPKAAVIHEVL
jgi:hypothetical protein